MRGRKGEESTELGMGDTVMRAVFVSIDSSFDASRQYVGHFVLYHMMDSFLPTCLDGNQLR